MTYKIVLTGGGTAGHVTPNIALIDRLQKEAWTIHYIGSKGGVEQEMIAGMAIPFHGVSSGKLRRYFSWRNFIDPMKIIFGIFQSFFRLYQIKPDIVFSKGGFVAFPVVIGAWVNRIPVVTHESDMTPGLANRLSFPFADKICLTFESAQNHFKRLEKVVVTGTPIRDGLLKGNKDKGLMLCGMGKEKPCVLVIGGSQGSQFINQTIRQDLDKLVQKFQIIHLCGKGNIDASLLEKKEYRQVEYAEHELADLFAASDIVISRSGANVLYEILALNKPHILIPLSRKASRGDQIQNARYFEKMGISTVIEEEVLTSENLISTLEEVNSKQEDFIQKMKKLNIQSSSDKIIDTIKSLIRKKV